MLTVAGRGGIIKLYCQYGKLNEVTDLMQTFISAKVSCVNEGVNFRSTKPDCSYSESMGANAKAQVEKTFI